MLRRLYLLIYLNNEWIPCGLLESVEAGRNSSGVFRYGSKYLGRAEAIPIDPVQLPLGDRTFETPEGFSIFNGIRDAGPDRWGRYLLDKKFARPLSEIEYLAASSGDRAGALAFADSPDSGPRQYEPGGGFASHPPLKRLGISQCAGAIEDAIASEETERLRRYLDYGPSLGGARPKATVVRGQDLHLAKFPLSLDSKNEPLIEYATMTLAKKCGLDVPPVHLEEIGGKSVFLIRRFDREKERRIPFISGLTITGTHESDFGAWSYFSLADAVIRFSGNPGKDLAELFRRLILNIAVNNTDDHPRNFGFLGSGRDWNLSPLYDVSPSPLHTETRTLAMTLGTEGRRASYKNALSLCERFRLRRAEALRIVDEVRETVSTWKRHFRNVGVSRAEIAMLENSFAANE